jgi:vacuolar-type H+-ATPase subunit E/Vma4
MGLDDIIDRIDEETQKEVDSILSRAREKAKEIREDNRREIEEELKERRKKLERELRTHRNVYISDGKRKSRQAILTAKEEVIWDALSRIRKSMGELEGDRLSAFIKYLREEAEGSLGEDMKLYPVRKKDADSLGSRENVNGIIEEGIEGEPPLSRFKGRKLIGGFVAVSSDNKKVLDMTFCGILSRDKERNREIIAKELFGSDER